MEDSDSDLGKIHLETSKGTMFVKQHKIPPHFVDEDGKLANPVSRNPLYHVSNGLQSGNA